jgi:hypothetical protein
MLSRKIALKQARQYRSCPPPHVFEDARQQEKLKQHLRICPYCEDPSALEERKSWAELTRRLQQRLKTFESGPLPEMIQPGQIRFIKPQLAHWQENRYYNPPCVLVTEVSPGKTDRITVAQIYHDTALAGPGDLILSEAQTGCFELFVECWHTYSYRAGDLGPPLGAVDAAILEAVTQMKKDPDTLPDWALLPMPMKEHDPRLYFRELEVEVGFAFASRAVAEIMAEMEQPRLVYETVGDLEQAIQKSAKVIRFPRRTAGLEETLAAAKFPPEAYAKAAAAPDDERERIPANLVVLFNGKIKEFKPIQGIITARTHGKDALSVGGAFPALPALGTDPRLACFYWSKATGAMVPDAMHWEVMTGTFFAKFKVDTPGEGTLEFALIYEIGET